MCRFWSSFVVTFIGSRWNILQNRTSVAQKLWPWEHFPFSSFWHFFWKSPSSGSSFVGAFIEHPTKQEVCSSKTLALRVFSIFVFGTCLFYHVPFPKGKDVVNMQSLGSRSGSWWCLKIWAVIGRCGSWGLSCLSSHWSEPGVYCSSGQVL